MSIQTRTPLDTSAEAAQYLEPTTRLDELIRRAADRTCEHFGPLDPSSPTDMGETATGLKRRMLLYAPLYLSNECVNDCPYCGFCFGLPVTRKHLTLEQGLEQAKILRGRGFRHILLVAGDFPRLTTTAYFADCIRSLRAQGIQPAIEIAPQSTDSYAELVDAGVAGVTLYQETYDETLYRTYHRRGPKRSFDWRFEGLQRAAEAGMQRLGMGILLGLAKPHEDFLRLVQHAAYLGDRFPDRTLAFGLPRLHETPENFQIPYPVSDDELVRMYCTLRLIFPKAELVLSTRESITLRAHLARICITQMSAGSSTAPGGYEKTSDGYGNGAVSDVKDQNSREQNSAEQFPIDDHRSVDEVAAWLHDAGFEPTWRILLESDRT